MVRNIVLAIALFLGIAVLTWYLADTAEAPPPPRPVAAAATAQASLIMLSPAGDFLPRRSLPPVTLRTELKSVTLRYYHVQDPALLRRLYRGQTQETLSEIALIRLLSDSETPLATVHAAPKNGVLAIDWQNPLPLGVQPGLYVVTAAKDLGGAAVAASWFFRTDLLATAVEDREAWHVFSQNLVTGQPVANVAIRWLGIGPHPLLEEGRSDAEGKLTRAKERFPANDVPQLLEARDPQGNTAFVPLRAVRLPPDDTAAADTFLFTDRQHYRAGQRVQLWTVGLGDKPEDIKLTLIRPDGLVLDEKPLASLQGRVGAQHFVLPAPARAGDWVIAAVGSDGVRHEVRFAVGEPDAPQWQSRLKLLARDGHKLTLSATMLDPAGRALPDQAVKLRLVWRGERRLAEIAPEFAFGGYDASEMPEQDIAGFVTGNGSTTLNVTLPPPPVLSYPVQAQLRLVAADGSHGEAQGLNVAFATEPWALGIKAQFAAEQLRGAANAEFRVGLFRIGAPEAKIPELRYELVTERRSYRFFLVDGVWDSKSDVATAPVRSGQITLDEKGQATVAMPVQRGQYRFEVFTPDHQLQSSWRFAVEPATPSPPSRDLAVSVQRDSEGLRAGVPATAGPSLLLALDQTLRQSILRAPAASVMQTLSAPLARGGYVIGVTPVAENTGLWQIARGLSWVGPQNLADATNAHMAVPPQSRAGDNATVSLTLPSAPPERKRYVQLVVRSANGAAPLLQPRAQPRALQANLIANIPAEWPAQALPLPPDQTLADADSTVSAVTAVPEQGVLTVNMPLPRQAGAATLHLLVWDGAQIGEQILPLTLAAASAAANGPSTPEATPGTLPPGGQWVCQPPLKDGQSLTLNLPHAGRAPLLTLAPLPLPDMPALLTQLYAGESARSDVLARSLLALDAYGELLAARGVTPGQLLAWQTRLVRTLLARQQGDGGFALYADGTGSDLTSSAFVLRAWPKFPVALQVPARERDLLDFLQHRLDVAWGAETELFARSDAFYALGDRNAIDPASLRYFVEKYGNAIRHGVFEAELAVALQSIGDKEQSRVFADRALAQLPSLRGAQSQTALQVLEVLVSHDLVAAADAVGKLPALQQQQPASSTLAAVTGALLWPELARRLPGWQAQLGGQNIARSGIAAFAYDAKTMAKLTAHGAAPVSICADYGNGAPSGTLAPATLAAQPVRLVQALYTPNGQPLKGARLMKGNQYVVVVSATDVTAGPAELVLPLPPGLALRAVLPGGNVVGQYSWLKQVDNVVSNQPVAQGWLLTLERPLPGPVRVAFVVAATQSGRINWPAPQLAQFNTTYHGAALPLVVE